MNHKACVACNFHCCIDTEGLLKVTGHHIPCKNGNVLEMVQDRDVVTTAHESEVICGYQIAPLLMTWSDFPVRYLYGCAAVDKILTITAHGAVHMR